MPYPAAIANAPQLDEGEQFFYDAFDALATCRNYEEAYIPWTAIRDYADEIELEGEQREDLFTIVRRLDAWFLEWLQAKRSKTGKAIAAQEKTKEKGFGRKG